MGPYCKAEIENKWRHPSNVETLLHYKKMLVGVVSFMPRCWLAFSVIILSYQSWVRFVFKEWTDKGWWRNMRLEDERNTSSDKYKQLWGFTSLLTDFLQEFKPVLLVHYQLKMNNWKAEAFCNRVGEADERVLVQLLTVSPSWSLLASLCRARPDE